jgi:Uma2 family endonuclease
MTAMVSRIDAPIRAGEYVPRADSRIVMRGLGWAGYQTLLALRGERRWPRMAYLDGAVELMGASRDHERIKSRIGRVVEAYCIEIGFPIGPYGNWHQQDESKEAGAEFDECYIVGTDHAGKDRPDLVIEVVWTHGGIDKLEIYRRLAIREAWFWEDDQISVHVLGPDGYEPHDRSTLLPDLDLAWVCGLLELETVNEVAVAVRAALVTHRR